MRKRSLLVVALALAIAPTAASAQSIEEQADELVGAWIAEARTYTPQVIRYARNCIVGEVVALPETERSLILEADSFNAGLVALNEANPEVIEALLIEVDACLRTMDLGEPVYDWIAETYPGLRLLERNPLAACLLDAVRPTSTLVKQLILLGDDFPHGVAVAAVTVPGDAAGLEDALAACQP